MSKVAVIFWSGTGNTEAMANAVLNGAKDAGADAELFTADSFDAKQIDSFDGIALGCPAMGAEELEDGEFLPMYESIKGKLSGKKVVLFGSYGWGDGEWMRNWDEEVRSLGADVEADFVIANDAPDNEAITACEELGAALAKLITQRSKVGVK